jgi:MoaA/NifB/PqqE/SkfB family radical SAM enzyme
MMVEASSTCNFLCPLCLWTQNHHHGQLQVSTFERLIGEARHFVRRICFSGRGEPTLNPNLYELLRSCSAAGVTADLATNGSHLLRDVERLLDSGVDNVNVSIEADNAEDYARYRVNGDFAAVTAGMRRLADEKRRRGLTRPKLQTCSVIFSYNEPVLERMKSFFRELGFEGFIFKSAHLGHGKLDEPTVVLRRRWLPQSRSLQRAGAGDPGPVDCDFLPRAQMLWNGDISRCAVDQNAMVVGNILESSFAELWRGERSRQAVEHIRSGQFAGCGTCEYSRREVTEQGRERYVL